MTAPEWRHLLPTPPTGGQLLEVWATSFEQPDADFLVEHFLPSLIGTRFSHSNVADERALFIGDLATRLEALRDRLTVIASASRSDEEDPAYPWLWRFVGRFMVGAQSRAVQHAKIWAFHWRVDHKEYIELHVSSTNLTSSAFKSQIQAGWQVRLELGSRASQRARQTWGDLIKFLEALGASAGDVATSRVQRLLDLLGRAECPDGVTFIASIPGEKNAARALRRFNPTELQVLTPTIGNWNHQTLRAWSKDLGISPERIHLNWISEEHQWAQSQGWTLSETTLGELRRNGVRLRILPIDARVADEHRDADHRWSHAKLYLLRCGRKRRLIVTSANWSIAAWGAGKVAAQNFELGVLVDTDWTDLESFGEPFDPNEHRPYLVDRGDVDEPESTLHWAECSWDGERIRLLARDSGDLPVTATLRFASGSSEELTLAEGVAEMGWADPNNPPLSVRFVQGANVLEVNVLDVRSPTKFAETPLPELDPLLAEKLREALLLERYGGPAVDPETLRDSGTKAAGAAASIAVDYSVAAWRDARTAFAVVDAWRAALEQAKGDAPLEERIRLDGEAFCARFIAAGPIPPLMLFVRN